MEMSPPRHTGNPLADPSPQRPTPQNGGPHKPFEQSLAECGLYPLHATGIEVLQINVGRRCNQACCHCHVDAGPERREIMGRDVMQACLNLLARADIPTLDITGGAPEMNPDFRWLVEQTHRLRRHVIDRSNLTILLEPGHDDLPRMLAEHQVEIIASLPCYLAENVDAQRGDGTFEKSIRAIRLLNALGYGRPESGLVLNLIHNPMGPNLPPLQASLEGDYRGRLEAEHSIAFNRLYTIANMPIGRFREELVRTDRYETYMELLTDRFNPHAAAGAMCRTMLSVDWQGRLYDCDFNQMLGLGLEDGLSANIRDCNVAKLATRRIATGRHCYGCTAGAGSSCQGVTAS
ncbi:MAG TPA: arsenosugar biosynthesis radical SAM (seleno)protein ArsS [Thermoguttaceae bacterium]|nr:arsenosugar biosynthesis radical SAM (seleno)protein ArsS [Thermoguttaceae bacterium]